MQVLLEIISGYKAHSNPEGDLEMIQWAEEKLAGGREGWRKVVDVRLDGDFHGHAVKNILKAAMACIKEDPHERPSMQTIVDTLKVAYSQALHAAQAPQESQGTQTAAPS